MLSDLKRLYCRTTGQQSTQGVSMRKVITSLVLLLILCSLASAKYNSEFYRELYDSLEKPELDFAHSIKVRDYRFKSDTAIFHLKEGTVTPFEAVYGQRYGFFFKGDGQIRLQPPVKPEKYILKRFTGDEVFDHEFDKAIFFLSPDYAQKLFPLGPPKESERSKKEQNWVERAVKLLIDYGYDLPADIMPKLLSSSESPFLMAVIDNRDRYYFIDDPTLTESICLYQHRRYRGYKIFHPVTKFFPREHYLSDNDPYHREQVYSIIPTHYQIFSTIENNTDIHVDATVNFVCQRDSLYRAEFGLSSDMIVDSVFSATNIRLFFSKLEDHSGVMVMLNEPLMAGDTASLRFFMNSDDVIKKTTWGDFYITAPTGWYPRVGWSVRSTFDLTYQTPRHLKFLSVGKKTHESETDDYLYTKWDVSEPVEMLGFNYGLFETEVVEEAGLPKITIYRSDPGHVGRLFSADMLEVTASDVTIAMQFYISTFGHYPYPELVVTEIPGDHGQSFPGFLHLGWLSFETDVSAKGFETDAFRAHEVSHQWWGNIVGWDTYHDQWLSEGFAQYSSAWFMQLKDQDNKRFLEILEAWQDDVTQKGGGTGLDWSEGSEAGAIWLGARLSSLESSDYHNIVYKKGAYILHMLRMMLHDYNRHADDVFIRMMREYVKTFRGKTATTTDFKQLVEKHFQMDMDWFFDQWVYGTGIPKYKTDYEVEEIDGKYQVTVQVEQEDVPPEFKMVMPMVVEMENETHTFFKFWVGGDSEDFITPLLPSKPKKIHFNPYHAVLCHID